MATHDSTKQKAIKGSAPGGNGSGELIDDEAQAQDPVGGSDEFDRSLEAWLDEKNHEDLPCRITLYKFKHPTTGTEKEQCCEWINEIPRQHEIGLKFGAGRYYLIINIPPGKNQKKNTTSRTFALHPYYDELKRQAQAQAFVQGTGPAAGPGLQIPPPAPAASTDQSLMILERLMGILAPILQSAMQARSTSPGAEMVQTYQALNGILKNNAMELNNMLTDMQRKNHTLSYSQEDGEFEPAPEKPSMLESIMPFIGQLAEKLLSGGPQAAGAASLIKTIPGFNQVMNNPREIKSILAYLDNTYGPDKTNIMLKKLKLGRPQ